VNPSVARRGRLRAFRTALVNPELWLGLSYHSSILIFVMNKQLTIGQLARVAGVPSSTLRYYERIGLLRPTGRTEGNYRLYEEEALERLKFIRAAHAMGFALSDVAVLLNHLHSTSASCRKVQALIAERLLEVESRMADLQHIQAVLKATFDRCRQTEQKGRCEIIDTITESRPQSPVEFHGSRPRKPRLPS
jgi:MerR family mercuric resistance operon transcriptional regulator